MDRVYRREDEVTTLDACILEGISAAMCPLKAGGGG